METRAHPLALHDGGSLQTVRHLVCIEPKDVMLNRCPVHPPAGKVFHKSLQELALGVDRGKPFCGSLMLGSPSAQPSNERTVNVYATLPMSRVSLLES